MCLRSIAFDYGHTLVNEDIEPSVFLPSDTAGLLMPSVRQCLERISLPMDIWANTRCAGEQEIRALLRKANIEHFFRCVVTSAEAGFRKPSREFFAFALQKCGLEKHQVLFVGNQLNTDIRGGNEYGILTVWLCGEEYQSADETLSPNDMRSRYRIRSLAELPDLIEQLKRERLFS